MKTALKVTSWITVIIGVLAFLGALIATDEYGQPMVDPYAVLGGLMFLTQGLLALVFIHEVENE